MDLRLKIWGFSADQVLLHSKDPNTGLPLSQLPIDLCSSEIFDICTTASKIYFLLCSKLQSVKFSNSSTKTHELPLGSYQSLIFCSKDIFVIGTRSLRFDIITKLCRKTSLSIHNSKVIAKTSYKDTIFFIVNEFEKGVASKICTYDTVKNVSGVYKMKERLEYMGNSISFYRENGIFVFGGKTYMGWASSDFFRVDLENLNAEFLKPMIKNSIFNINSYHQTANRVSAIDCKGFMHIFYFSTNQWKLISEPHWQRCKSFLYIWKTLKKIDPFHPLGKLNESIVRKLLNEFF